MWRLCQTFASWEIYCIISCTWDLMTYSGLHIEYDKTFISFRSDGLCTASSPQSLSNKYFFPKLHFVNMNAPMLEGRMCFDPKWRILILSFIHIHPSVVSFSEVDVISCMPGRTSNQWAVCLPVSCDVKGIPQVLCLNTIGNQKLYDEPYWDLYLVLR